MSGIVFGELYPGWRLGAILLTALCAAAVGYLFINKKSSFCLPVCLFICLGYLSLQPWHPLNAPAEHISNYKDRRHLNITGTIVGLRTLAEDRHKIFLKVEGLTQKGAYASAAGHIQVTIRGQTPELRKGSRIYFRAKVRSFRNFNNPGRFDYERYMAFRGLCGSAYVRGKDITALPVRPSIMRLDGIESIRENLSRAIEQTEHTQVGEILKALIVGKREGLVSQTRETFQRAGIGHILAISGLHVGLVAAAVYGSAFALLAWIPLMLRKAWTRKGAALLSLIPVLWYGLLAGMSPSTQRAVIMVGVFMMTFWIEREHDPLNTLAVAAFVILLIDPPALFSASFQLSFMAVAAILFGFMELERPLAVPQKIGPFFWNKLVNLLKVSLFAFIGTLPLVMFYFDQLSLVGPLVNLLVVPVLGGVILPFGLGAAFLHPLLPEIAGLGFQLAATGLMVLLAFIEWIAAIPYAAVKTVTPSLMEIVAYYIFIGAVWILNRSKSPLSADSMISSKRILDNAAFVLSVLAIVYISVSTMVDLATKLNTQPLRITVIDVKQGSAALVQLPDGHCMLIDGGGFSDHRAFDMGRLVIAPLLRQKRIHRIDTLVLTHPQADHLNGLLHIAEKYQVRHIWSNGQQASTWGFGRLMEIVEAKQIRMPDFNSSRRQHILAGVDLSILYPPPGFLERSKFERWRDTNNNSLVLHLQYGAVSFLFPGDIHSEAEQELVGLYGKRLQSTVLIAPHHGSRTSSTLDFLNSVQPKIVAISSGFNRKGFPHPSVLNRYKAIGASVYRTDQHGAVEFITDGHTLRIHTMRLDQ
jgi:competence protein ComEC